MGLLIEVSTVCFHQFEGRGLHIMQFCNTTPSISQVKSSSLSIFNVKQQLCRIFKLKSLWSFHILCHSITSVYKTNIKPGGLCSILGQVSSGGSASTKFCVEQKPQVMHLSHWNIGKHWTVVQNPPMPENVESKIFGDYKVIHNKAENFLLVSHQVMDVKTSLSWHPLYYNDSMFHVRGNCAVIYVGPAYPTGLVGQTNWV